MTHPDVELTSLPLVIAHPETASHLAQEDRTHVSVVHFPSLADPVLQDLHRIVDEELMRPSWTWFLLELLANLRTSIAKQQVARPSSSDSTQEEGVVERKQPRLCVLFPSLRPQLRWILATRNPLRRKHAFTLQQQQRSLLRPDQQQNDNMQRKAYSATPHATRETEHRSP